MIIDDLNPLFDTLEDIIQAEKKKDIQNATILNLTDLIIQARKDLKKHQDNFNKHESVAIEFFELLATIETSSNLRHKHLEKTSDYDYYPVDNKK